ncbi:glycosyltransferase family 39 protein [Phyllobacterium sp. A18/5-2]|jgi:4-amino-4-deoxy-L-arabinose transferase-like glycosyltransferase|uniref:ArnT family glycosyltransferase n=1 Tax=Phyllobacterium sp. A18/5-2 TaxID=2978392 RepID=UPI0021CA43A1|nr:glycosyltransferase family 39 protein [Phyllobacterium sp. A18/5-2]UXN64653.1 glycosyltransferase family 39 protein [Phyllobacterium sp. A18/5-2]
MTHADPAPGSARRLRASHYLLLIFICLVSFVPGIASIPPLDRDESRYIQATHQMAESGDYVDIRFQDSSRYKKPIGIYWLQSAALKLTGYGDNTPVWTYRLVSVAGATLAVIGTAALGAFFFGQSAGLLAGIALAAIVMLGFEARVAKTDATVLATVVFAQGALAWIWMASRVQAAERWTPALIFWVATAIGVLIKGPITPFISLLTMGTLSLFYREWRWLKRLKPLSGVLILLAIVLPWLILITLKSGGAFFNESVNKDFLSKVGDAQESHGAPPGYFALIFVFFIWPFGVLAIRGGLQALSRLREDPRLAFLMAWYIPFWLVTELVPTKLPHYILPAYPAVLLMMAWAVDTGIAMQPYRGRWQIWLERLTLLGLAAATLALMGAGLVLPYVMTGSFSFPGVIVFFTALAAGIFASGLILNQNLKGALQAAATFAIITLGLLTWGVIPALTPIWLSPAIANAFNAAKPCSNSVLASARYTEPSLVFLAGTKTLLTDGQGAAQHLLRDPACAISAVDDREHDAFISNLPQGERSVAAVATVSGVNYSKGRRMTITLYKAVK